MAIPVLIITPTPGFGDLIYITLRDAGYYQPVLVNTGLGALASARQIAYAVMILDADLEDTPLSELVNSINEILPNIRLIVISSQSNGDRPSLEHLEPHGYLSKPFYLPDLLDKVADVLGENVATQVSPSSPTAEKPSNSNKYVPAFANLPSFPGIHSSPAAATRPHPPYWLNDVSRVAQHLTRLSLESAAQAALIMRAGQLWAYAGQLSQAAVEELVQLTQRYWEHDGGSDLVRFIHLEITNSEFMLYATSIFADTLLVLAFDAGMPFSKIRAEAGQLARALAEPPAKERSVEPVTTEATPEVATPEVATSVNPIPRLLNPPERANKVQTKRLDDPQQAPADQSAPVESLVQTETDQPVPAEITDQAYPLLPISGAVYHLSYACLLIPRLPEHHLTGGLSKKLSQWLPQLCLAFDLRLDRLSIRPAYLAWIAEVNPHISPDEMIHHVRQHTSQRIFSEYADLARQNPSGDFWADSYLVLGGSQLPPAQMINDFIKQSRQRQGAGLSLER
jgi:REP element-mobilizing transposase RayT/DNA-binding NarL/FixJ family response regulator